MKRFNNWLANRLGKILGNMYFFYFCVVIDLIMLPPVIKAHDTITWVTYIAQTVIQLLALPVLQVYQNLQSSNHEELLSHVKAIHKHLGIKHHYRKKP